MLRYGAQPNDRDYAGWTPLCTAAVKYYEPLINLLLDQTNDSKTTVERVSLLGRDSAKRDFLEHMAERKSAGSTVVSGLQAVVNDRHAKRVLALLEEGADIDGKDVDGTTALNLAVWLSFEDMTRLLLEHGA